MAQAWPRRHSSQTFAGNTEEDVFLCHQGFRLIDYESDVGDSGVGRGPASGSGQPREAKRRDGDTPCQCL